MDIPQSDITGFNGDSSFSLFYRSYNNLYAHRYSLRIPFRLILARIIVNWFLMFWAWIFLLSCGFRIWLILAFMTLKYVCELFICILSDIFNLNPPSYGIWYYNCHCCTSMFLIRCVLVFIWFRDVYIFFLVSSMVYWSFKSRFSILHMSV